MTHAATNLEPLARRALTLITDGMVVGLGSGKASTAFIHALGRSVEQGLRIRGVPTSEASSRVAREYGIPLVGLDDVDAIDLTVDGADEVDPHCNCIKGYGAALVREKIVAAATRRLVILVGSEKLVQTLGQRGKLPVEVIAFGLPWCQRRIADLGYRSLPRVADGERVLSDNGNPILDIEVRPIDDAVQLELALRSIEGVVGTGLFLGMVDTVLVAEQGEVREMKSN
jgi:ribose 5-phosphate isomerase A